VVDKIHMKVKKKKSTAKKCWKGYTKKGIKLKGGKKVNNCVKKKK